MLAERTNVPVGQQRIIFCGRELNASGRPLKHSGVGVNRMLAIHMVARRGELLCQKKSTKSRKKIARVRPTVINFADDEPIFPVIPTAAATRSGDSGDSFVINLVDDSPIAGRSRRRRRKGNWGEEVTVNRTLSVGASNEKGRKGSGKRPRV